MTTGYFGTVLLGLLLFIIGTGSFVIEVCGFKYKIDEFTFKLFSSKVMASGITALRTGVAGKDRND
jgi:hypothetical protein